VGNKRKRRRGRRRRGPIVNERNELGGEKIGLKWRRRRRWRKCKLSPHKKRTLI
jgi:hypothetical protein